VRKQYHFQPGVEGLDAWDVDRLITASAGLPVHEVAVDSIREVDTDHWFVHGPTPTVRRVIEHVRLIEEADRSYPIILGADGRVMDGMHRIAQAILDGRPTIPAVRFEVDPEPDFTNCLPADLPY
jgi:hypothetical protein